MSVTVWYCDGESRTATAIERVLQSSAKRCQQIIDSVPLIAAKLVVIPVFVVSSKAPVADFGRTKYEGAYARQAGRCCMQVICRDGSVAKDEW